MPDQFYALTWNQYCLKCQGFFNKERKDWEKIGWATWNSMRVHVTKGMPSYRKFMSFLYADDKMESAKLDKIKESMNKAMSRYIEEKNAAGT